MSAEYILAGGNPNVILCERGIRTFETYTRNTLDLSAVLAAKQMTHLPVVVDPSHACGIRWMVEPMALAAVARIYELYLRHILHRRISDALQIQAYLSAQNRHAAAAR